MITIILPFIFTYVITFIKVLYFFSMSSSYGQVSFNFSLKYSIPFTMSYRVDGETVEIVSDFIFGGSEITAEGDCSHEVKRRLLLERKVMTHLDSILKSRDITLPTKIRLVKAMVFPVVMYGCESWTVKKAEHQIIDAF